MRAHTTARNLAQRLERTARSQEGGRARPERRPSGHVMSSIVKPHLLLIAEEGPLPEELDERLVALFLGGREVGAGHEGAGHRVLEARLLHLRPA